MLIVAALLLAAWATEGKLHPFDTASTTLMAIAVLPLPGIGAMGRKKAQSSVPWGTLLLFGVGVALGTLLVATRGAPWLGGLIVDGFHLRAATPFVIIAVMSALLILVHLRFASATALSSAFIPIVISVLQEVSRAGVPVNVLGVTMILQFAVSFGFMLVVNAPQNMVAYGTGSFTGGHFTCSAVVITLLGYGVMLVLAATWWPWLGLTTL